MDVVSQKGKKNSMTIIVSKGRGLSLLKDKAKFTRKRGPQKTHEADLTRISSEYEQKMKEKHSRNNQEVDMN
jgi:hypothetical protein